MFDILTAIFHDDPLQFGTACYLQNPQTAAAKELGLRVEALVREQSELAFCSGARFGAQLMAQLLEELQ